MYSSYHNGKSTNLLIKIGILLSIFTSHIGLCASQAEFPKDYKNWILVKETVIPGQFTKIPKGLSLFFEHTIKTYNWINEGRGTRLDTYVNPEKIQEYLSNGPYSDGITSVGVFLDSDIVFVTEHFAGNALYGSYDLEGKDITHQHPSFDIKVCESCHHRNNDICKYGICTSESNKLREVN